MKNQDLQLVNFEQAERLDKSGFDWDTLSRYDYSCRMITETNTSRNHNDKNKWTNKDKQGCSAPTVALALKWMRDVKELMCGVAVRATNGGYAMYEGSFRYGIIGLRGSNMCDTYESAESALLDELLTLLETK